MMASPRGAQRGAAERSPRDGPGRELVAEALELAARAGADAADCLLLESDAFEARVRGDEVDFVKQAREHTLGLRALVRGSGGFRSAVTSTSDLSPAALAELAAASAALARETAPDPFAGLPEDGFAGEGPDLRLLEPLDREVSPQEHIAAARRAEAAARAADPRIANSEGSDVGSAFTVVTYGSSAGFLGSYECASHSLACQPLARENGSQQRDHWFTAARRRAELETPEAVGRRAAERALRRLGARRVPTCEVPVIFDALTAPSLLGQLAGCLAGSAVYREASCLAGRLGERIASDLVSVVDDGLRPGGLGSRPFDGEGQASRRTPLLARGRLESYLLDSYAARKLGMRSTGSAGRSPGGPPFVSPANLWLEPGPASLAEIVADTKRGLLVTELIGMGFNPVTGDYSRGAAGIWIEGGALTHPVEEVTIAGNLLEMLLAIDAVGSDLEWRGRIASPSLRIAKLTVAGT